MNKKQQLEILGKLRSMYVVLSDNEYLGINQTDYLLELCNDAISLLEKIDVNITLQDVFDILSERMDFRPDIEPDINCRCMVEYKPK